MTLRDLYHQFLKLPTFYKYLGAGSFLLAVSTLMPWYSDIDAYRVGDLFLGVTGPASVVGIVILMLSVISFGLFFAHLRERRRIRLPVKESVYNLFVGVQSIFLLLLVSSIYFHPKFGVNILLKEVRFGMVLAFVGSIFMTVGGYFQQKREMQTEDLVGKLEPLVTFPQKEEKPRMMDMERRHGIVEKKSSIQEVTKLVAAKQESLLREEESKREEPPQNPPKPPANIPFSRPPSLPTGGQGSGHTGGGSYMWKPGL